MGANNILWDFVVWVFDVGFLFSLSRRLKLLTFGVNIRGSTTAITFCVDSYRQVAGEALVTLNVSKDIFHGLVFSLFVTGWVESEGPKTVYRWIGIIQLIVLATTVPMFLFGKRARNWTAGDDFYGNKSVIFRRVSS